MKKLFIAFIILWAHSKNAYSQFCPWQMSARYEIDIDFNHQNHQYSGTQKVVLYNQSPDSLTEVFFHLYFNAFQPGSAMDIRSRNLPDPDPRIGNRISKLEPADIGYMRIQSIKSGKQFLPFTTQSTWLKTTLTQPCLPGDSIVLNLVFEAQVPIQIRRSGRNNKEGIDYSMAQWYPKLCQYDCDGWHPDPYIAREFYGIFSNYSVSILIDQSFCLGYTGVLQNPGNANCLKPNRNIIDNKLKWHITAENVHDFVWSADRDYVFEVYKRSNGCTLETVYQPDSNYIDEWQALPSIIDSALAFIESHYGPYPYPKFAIIQGGDGGMEYPMATLITGKRPLVSLVGVTIHELLHSWFHGMLASNEQLYAWMDEGFTSFVEIETMNYLRNKRLIPGEYNNKPHLENVRNYLAFQKTGLEEPMNTPSDYYSTNKAYGIGSYVKGAMCLYLLNHMIGHENFSKGMLLYYWHYRFKHPTPSEFFRVMEKVSGFELDWFQHHLVNTTNYINYTIDTVYTNKNKLHIELRNQGAFPMPVELRVVLTDKSEYLYYIPTDLQIGLKTFPAQKNVFYTPPWPWVQPTYNVELDLKQNKVYSISINRMWDMPDIDSFNDELIFYNE